MKVKTASHTSHKQLDREVFLEKEKTTDLLPHVPDDKLCVGSLVTHSMDNSANGIIVSDTTSNEYCEVLWSSAPNTLNYKTMKSMQAAINSVLHRDVDIESTASRSENSTPTYNYFPSTQLSKLSV